MVPQASFIFTIFKVGLWWNNDSWIYTEMLRIPKKQKYYKQVIANGSFISHKTGNS